MNTTGRQHRWIYATLGGVVALLAISQLFRGPGVTQVKTVKSPPRPAAGIQIIPLKKNDTVLTDPTPLYLPTEWNAGQNALPANTQREPGGSFQGYPAKLAFAESELKLRLPAPVTVPARPADAVALDRSSQSFLGVGQVDQVVTQLTDRKAFIEIVDSKSGRQLFSQAIGDANPPAGAWEPLEFLVAVDPMGMVGPPVLTESSRVAAVDAYFQNYLVKTLHAGQRLAPGFYRVSIGP